MNYRQSSPPQQRSAASIPMLGLFCVMMVLVGVAVLLGAADGTSGALVAAALCAFCLLFHRVTVTITGDQITLAYGIGVVRRVFDIHALSEVSVVPNRSLMALYNPGAESVLFIADRSGRRAYIPLFEPRQLLVFLRAHGDR